MAGTRPWIRWIGDEEATGRLAELYDAARKRAGKVFHIVRIMSLRPSALEASMNLYRSLMRRKSPRLGRAEREMVAVVVSQTNGCHY